MMSCFTTRFVLLSVCCGVLFTACASPHKLQPKVHQHLRQNQLDFAIQELSDNENAYGSRNQLLYHLDKGLLLHYAGRYQESIDSFLKAHELQDNFYTTSVSQQSLTWLINDNFAPYRGEDFEYVLASVFLALNYEALGQTNEALVEARKIDQKLKLLQDTYSKEKTLVYVDDPFARMLSGLLYEQSEFPQDKANALVDYRLAIKGYERLFVKEHDVAIPSVLLQNAMGLAKTIDQSEFETLKANYGRIKFQTPQDREALAEVYLIHYVGYSPVKHPIVLDLPIEGDIVQMAFPEFRYRDYDVRLSKLKAIEADGTVHQERTELVSDIEYTSVRDLESRRIQIMAKGAIRPILKHMVQNQQQKSLKKDNGKNTADIARVVFNAYQVWSEQADLRSWQTLPAQIRLTRMLLAPGEYEFFLEEYDENQNGLGVRLIEELQLHPGEIKWLITRSFR